MGIDLENCNNKDFDILISLIDLEWYITVCKLGPSINDVMPEGGFGST